MSESPSRARQIPCSGKLCRNLFGPVDHEQLQQDCQDLMQSCTQEAQRRWNFDFITETPLEGDFAWERVRGLDLPSIYRPSGPWGREDLGGKRPKPRPSSPALLQMSAQGDHVDLSLSCTVVPLTPEREEGSMAGTSQPTRKHKQTSMTGFLPFKAKAHLQEKAMTCRLQFLSLSGPGDDDHPSSDTLAFCSSVCVCFNYCLYFNLNSSLYIYAVFMLGGPWPM